MRSDLDHLPAVKRHELDLVQRILFEEFEDALKGRNAPHRKAGRILKIVLFGSYARGDWVADPIGGYFSDYDLLVVVNHDELADVMEYWRSADDRLLQEQTVTGRLRTPTNFIVHSLSDVNRQLQRGRPFFVDIVRDGIALYEAANYPLEQPKTLSVSASRAEAQKHFDHWMPLATHALRLAQVSIEDDIQRDAAFLLHQATERFYHCTLLVLTLYSPKSHKLNVLRSQAERIAPSLINAWPRDTRFAQRSFELLRRAYVDARYSPHYKITEEELAWIVERITVLQGILWQICQEHLNV